MILKRFEDFIRRASSKAKSDRRCPEKRARSPLGIESLESKVLLSTVVVTDLRDIADSGSLVVVQNHETPNGSIVAEQPTERYTFSLSRPANVIARLSDLQRENILFFTEPEAELQFVSLGGIVSVPLASRTYGVNTGEQLEIELLPGDYAIDLPPQINVGRYDLMVVADTAPGTFATGSFNPLVSERRSLDILRDGFNIDVNGYVGIGTTDANHPALNEVVDTYSFDLIHPGVVEFEIDTDSFNIGILDIIVFQDSDGDGIFERGTNEELGSRTKIPAGELRSFSRNLPFGNYGIAILASPPSDNGQPVPTPSITGKSNYRLSVSYSVPDTAGNTLANAREIVLLNNTTVALSEYVSAADPFDIYQFSTTGAGPFAFEGSLSVITSESNFELEFIRDLNDNGEINSNEIVVADRPGSASESIEFSYPTPGDHFVRVRRTAGEGPYVLRFLNRNTDLAGNSLRVAKDIGLLVGAAQFADTVNSTDVSDFFKFTLDRQAEFRARLAGMPAGTDANLSLIRDVDGDNIIDIGDTLASSTAAGNAIESILRNLTAGTYFIRVNRVAGTPSYNLRLVKDAVGDSLGSSLLLSVTGGTNADFLGPEDDTDVFRFAIGSPRQVGMQLGPRNEPIAIRLGQDLNGNGTLDGNEQILDRILEVSGGELLKVNLGVGTHFLVLNPLIQDEGTNYALTLFNAPPDNAGNSLTEARDLAGLPAQQTFVDFVGDGSINSMDDLDDFYRFTPGLNGEFVLNAQLTNLTANANLQLIRDDNRNGIINAGEVLFTTTTVGTAPDFIIRTLLTAGTHYLRVFRADGQADYSLRVSLASIDTAGNSLDAAASIGVLTDRINEENHFVGDIDNLDFFRFSVNSPCELHANLNGNANSSAVIWSIIRDADNDGTVDSNEILASRTDDGASDFLHGLFLPVAGNYFLRVGTLSGESRYDFELAFSPQTPFDVPFEISATAPTEIKAVRFDKGGQGISYSDSTVANTGNQPGFRSGEAIRVDVSTTVDPISAGRRVTNTAPNEFLEYSIHVAEAGLYDFEARVASPDLGATFRLDIDQRFLLPVVAVPDTNGADNMVTVVAGTNVFLTEGPHILRINIETDTNAADDFAGSFNFIRVRPSTTGTFHLTPTASTVAAGESTQLELTWTVPQGGWTVLNQVDLRLRDDQGRLIWIRFDEATRTVSLYNSSTGKFGPAKKLGSNTVLSGPLADLNLSSSSFAAAGPSDPTVTLSFDLRFKGNSRGTYQIETAATDDLGHSDPFRFAGTLEIV